MKRALVLLTLWVSAPGVASTIPTAPQATCLRNDDWASAPGTVGGSVKFRLWAACSGGTWQADLDRAMREIAPVWTKLTALFGAPRPDTGVPDPPPLKAQDIDPDDAFDVWLPRAADPMLRKSPRLPPAAPPGGTFRDTLAHFDYGEWLLVASRDAVGSDAWRHALVHELALYFLASQQGHVHDSWVLEAMATWAETELLTATTPTFVYEPLFENAFQKEEPASRFTQAAAGTATRKQAMTLFPLMLFAIQQQGRSAMAGLLASMGRTRNDPVAVMRTALSQLDWRTQAIDFALRDVNSQFAGDRPVSKLFSEGNHGFPLEKLPLLSADHDLNPRDAAGAQGPFRLPVSLPVAGARYFRFHVNDSVQQLELDWSALPASHRAVALIHRIHGKQWKVEKVDTDRKYYCRAKPEEKLDDVWVVLANTTDEPSARLEGDVTIKTLASPCQVVRGSSTHEHAEDLNLQTPDGSKSLHARITTTVTGLELAPRNGEPSPYLHYVVTAGQWSVRGTSRLLELSSGCRHTEDRVYSGSGKFLGNLAAHPEEAASLSMPSNPMAGMALMNNPGAMNSFMRQMGNGSLTVERASRRAILTLRLPGVDNDQTIKSAGENCATENAHAVLPHELELVFDGRFTGTPEEPRFELGFQKATSSPDEPELHLLDKGSGSLGPVWKLDGRTP